MDTTKSKYEADQFRLLVEGVKDYAIFMLDPEGFVSTWNEGAERIKGYPNEFGQVLLNILMNARDALQETGTNDARITVRSWTEDGRAKVTIADNAGGIQEEIMDKIFDPFFTTKELDKGTGIGLFMSKTIIEKDMGGRLTVCNAGGGAEFRIEV